MAGSWGKKDPDAILDYAVDWSSWLAGSGNDTISGSAWIVPADLTKETDSFSDTATLIWLSGGVVDEDYEIVNRITTAGGRVEDRTMKLKCRER